MGDFILGDLVLDPADTYFFRETRLEIFMLIVTFPKFFYNISHSPTILRPLSISFSNFFYLSLGSALTCSFC